MYGAGNIFDVLRFREQGGLYVIESVERSGIPRISCSGAHGYNGHHAVQAARVVKENTKLELLVNDIVESIRKVLG